MSSEQYLDLGLIDDSNWKLFFLFFFFLFQLTMTNFVRGFILAIITIPLIVDRSSSIEFNLNDCSSATFKF